jgi:hypothetical protein
MVVLLLHLIHYVDYSGMYLWYTALFSHNCFQLKTSRKQTKSSLRVLTMTLFKSSYHLSICRIVIVIEINIYLSFLWVFIGIRVRGLEVKTHTSASTNIPLGGSP